MHPLVLPRQGLDGGLARSPDYRKVLELFPLVEAHLYRREAARHAIDDSRPWSRAYATEDYQP